MDIHQAAQLLGVAAHEITSVEKVDYGWVAVHEDYASHITTRRWIPIEAPNEPIADERAIEAEPSAESVAVLPKRRPKKAVADDSTSS